MPKTLCTSAFQPSDGIWYIYSHNHAKKPGHRFTRLFSAPAPPKPLMSKFS